MINSYAEIILSAQSMSDKSVYLLSKDSKIIDSDVYRQLVKGLLLTCYMSTKLIIQKKTHETYWVRNLNCEYHHSQKFYIYYKRANTYIPKKPRKNKEKLVPQVDHNERKTRKLHKRHFLHSNFWKSIKKVTKTMLLKYRGCLVLMWNEIQFRFMMVCVLASLKVKIEYKSRVY